MICEKHNRWIPIRRCIECESEKEELEHAVRMAEIENRNPIVLWEGKQ